MIWGFFKAQKIFARESLAIPVATMRNEHGTVVCIINTSNINLLDHIVGHYHRQSPNIQVNAYVSKLFSFYEPQQLLVC